MMGYSHQHHDVPWSTDIVEDDPEVLRNAKQIGCDCGLYMIINPILLQEGVALDIFGTTTKEKDSSRIEMGDDLLCHYFTIRTIFKWTKAIYKQMISILKKGGLNSFATW